MNDRNQITNSEEFAKTQPFPNENDPDRIAEPMGVQQEAEKPLNIKEKLERRDKNPFELDPDSRANP
ncbi:MAG: DUF6335 family protein [Prochloraceae cyanobacterium]